MLSSRRAKPIPLDYEYALRRHGLTDRLLRPHLKPPVPRSNTQLTFELQEAEEHDVRVVPELLGKELSGASDKLTKPFIPKKFPAFPSKHTYKATEVVPERETDPRKIREKATEAARHGEEALRRLVGVGKVGDQKGVRKALIKSPAKRLKHELWDKAMEDLKVTNAQNGAAKTEQDVTEQGILIDAGRKYGRQPTSRIRT
jgi:transcription initiation factor TFIID subunit 8